MRTMRTFNWYNMTIDPHFTDGMAERDVDFEQVARILRRPDVTEPHKGATRFVGEGLCFIVEGTPDAPLLKTILKRDRDRWTNADMRNRHIPG